MITCRRALAATGWLGPSRLLIENGVIAAVEPHVGSTDFDLLSAGFVDLQVNGIDGIDVCRAERDQWCELDDLLLAQGTTSWCPTLVTMSRDRYAPALARIAAAMGDQRLHATILGAHLEGPFLGTAIGAHRSDMVTPIDLGWISALPDHVRIVTLGAEQTVAAQAVELLAGRGVLVSIGHSTASDSQLDAASLAGATMVTHLYNAMSGLHHRTPGVAAWAMTHDSISASIIADGVHVHPRMIRLAFQTLGPERMVLVTDAVAWMSGGAGPVSIEHRDGAPRLVDGTLAGSALRMDAAIRLCVDSGVPLDHALWAASRNPARSVGMFDRGSIGIGLRADLVAMSPQLMVQQVWTAGVQVD